MSSEQLRASWDKALLPESLAQIHFRNLEDKEQSGKNVIGGRIHVDVINTLVEMNSLTERYECIKPIHDFVLKLVAAGKDVRLVSSLSADSVKPLLKRAGADPRITERPVIERSALLQNIQYQTDFFELLIDDKAERLPVHVTHLTPTDIIKQAQNEPS